MNALIHDFTLQVMRHWNNLEEGNEHSQQWLTKRFLPLYHSSKSHHTFQEMLHTDAIRVNTDKGYLWSSLYENEQCRMGLLHIPAGSEIPLHDHRECIGVSLVIKGNPIISHYDLPKDNKAYISTLNKENSSEHHAKNGDLSYIFPQKGNIHGFSSSSQSDTILLNIIFQKKSPEMRHYYLPHMDYRANSSKSIHSMKWLGQTMMINLLSLNIAIASCNEHNAIQKADQAIKKGGISHFNEQCKDVKNIHVQFKIAERFRQDGKYHDAYLWYLKSAKGGNPDSQFELAMSYLDGLGVTEDAYEALEWLSKSSDNGHKQANEVMAYLLENPEPLDC